MHYVVMTAHRSNYPDPIQFAPGERVTLGRRDEAHPGWIRVTIASGNEGWAPESLLRIESEREAVALSAYTARELDTEVGERVTVEREMQGWYWVSNASGRSGWIPANTVEAE